jgi:hypothetical protein
MSKTAQKKKVGTKAINAYVKPVKLSSLTPSGRRVAIAEDVIAGLNAKRLIATSGSYVATELPIETHGDNVELQKILAENLKSCEVCAKGAMFIAAVEKFDKLKLNIDEYNHHNVLEDFNQDDAVCDHLENYFKREQLDLIEKVFEGADFLEDIDLYNSKAIEEENFVAVGYLFKFPDATDRMIAIMENVIRNKGVLILDIEQLALSVA